MKHLTLVVMAAGMGSRFGGLKQITQVDQDGNFLIDYPVYDAIRAGFERVVFIIKKENLEDFKQTIGKRLEDKIEVCYSFQEMKNVPSFVKIPEDRVKPWGTVHAILSAKDAILDSFAVINADDFYGSDSYKIIADYLKTSDSSNEHISIPYPFCNVSSPYGFVKRGVLFFEQNKVQKILECNVGYQDGKVLAKPLDGSEPFFIEEDHPVSMNIFGFKKSILPKLEEYFVTFMKKNQENLESAEALLPIFLEEYLEKNEFELIYQTSKGTWLGMTYKEDLEEVKKKINELKMNGEYPDHLWQEYH